jgi:hypothetical protein
MIGAGQNRVCEEPVKIEMRFCLFWGGDNRFEMVSHSPPKQAPATIEQINISCYGKDALLDNILIIWHGQGGDCVLIEIVTSEEQRRGSGELEQPFK